MNSALVAQALSLWPDSVTTSMTMAKEPGNPGKDPRFRGVVESILFSRRFVPTYNLVLLAVLGVFTAWHFWENFALRRRKRRRNQDIDKTSNEEGTDAGSSSSITIGGLATPPVVKEDRADERSPLLATGRRRRSALGVRKPYHRARSWMQYQPRPIPIVNKTLPTNAVSLCVTALIALNVFYNFYDMPLSLYYIPAFADRCGLLFVANLPVLYLLAAKNQPIKLLTGFSYESLNVFHRRVGELLCLEALLHALGMLFTWYGFLRHLGFSLARFLTTPVILLGIGAFVSYEVLYFTSLGSSRQRMYEVFLATHIILQIAGLAFLWFHYTKSRPYVAACLAVFLIDRLVFRLWLKSSSHPATLTVLEDDETLVVSANWDITDKSSGLLSANMQKGWKPNHHVFLTVPALSRKHALQSHPLTIFSAAPTTGIDAEGKHAWFSLLIRAQSDSGFTHTLLNHARTHTKTHIRLDGPYGSSHALETLSVSDTAILVAGGSGIAVAYPLLYHLLQPTSSDAETGRTMSLRKVKLVWVTHSASHASWVPEDKLKELRDWGLELCMPPPTYMAGRPDVRSIVGKWVGDGRTGIVVSGPDGLVRDVRNTCAELMAQGVDVEVQVEKFGW